MLTDLTELQRLIRFDRWANQEVLASFRAAGSVPERSLRLLGHIIGAQFLWHSRIVGVEPRMEVWPELDLEQCAVELDELAVHWSEFLESRPEPGKEVSYRNSKGEPWTSAVADILTHVVMHSVYHRGQIASDMRASGEVPAYTDFIHAVRQKRLV